MEPQDTTPKKIQPEDYQNRLTELCDKLIAWFGWDIEAETKKVKETGIRQLKADWKVKETVHKAKAAALDKYSLGITEIYNTIDIDYGLREFAAITSAEDMKPENMKRKMELMTIITEIEQLHEDYDKGEFVDIKRTIGQSDLFNNPDLEIDTYVIQVINKLVTEGTFKIHKFEDTGEELQRNDKFYLSTTIGFSEGITMWLDHVRQQQDFLETQPTDTVFVTLFGKIDPVHSIYSHWILTIHKKGTTWISTDQVNFDNPMQKRVRLERKSAWREYGEKYDACDLPYWIFHDMDKLREEQTGIAKTDTFETEKVDWHDDHKLCEKDFSPFWKESTTVAADKMKEYLNSKKVDYDVVYGEYEHASSDTVGEITANKQGRIIAHWIRKSSTVRIYRKPEVLFKDLNGLKELEKAFLLFLIREIIDYGELIKDEIKEISLARDFINQKMIEGAEINPGDTTRMGFWTEEAKYIYGELDETLSEGGKKSTALAIKTYDIVPMTKEYDHNWLATPEALTSLSEWVVLESEKDKVRDKIRELKKTQKESSDQLYEMLNKRTKWITDTILSHAQIMFFSSAFGSWSSEEKDNEITNTGWGCRIKPKRSDQKGYGIGKQSWREELCPRCHDWTSKSYARIEVRHYKELMWYLGLKDRNQLPKYYRQYRAHDMIPYGGNHILNQTHPYLRAKDPCSQDNPNGIRLAVYICGHCAKKIKQSPQTIAVKYWNTITPEGGQLFQETKEEGISYKNKPKSFII